MRKEEQMLIWDPEIRWNEGKTFLAQILNYLRNKNKISSISLMELCFIIKMLQNTPSHQRMPVNVIENEKHETMSDPSDQRLWGT